MSELPPSCQPSNEISSFWNVVGFTITRMPFDSVQFVVPALASVVVAVTLPAVGFCAISGLSPASSFHASTGVWLTLATSLRTWSSVGDLDLAGGSEERRGG